MRQLRPLVGGSWGPEGSKPHPCSRKPVGCGAGATALPQPSAAKLRLSASGAPAVRHGTASVAAPAALAVRPAPLGASAAAVLPVQLPAQQHQQQAQQLTPQQSRLLTRHITRCDSWRELQQLLQAAGPALNAIHVSAMLSRLGKLIRNGSCIIISSSTAQQLQIREQQQRQHQQQQQQQQQHEEEQAELVALESFLQQLEAASIRVMSVVQLQQVGDLEIWRHSGPRLLLQQHQQQQQHSFPGSDLAGGAAPRHQQQLLPALPQQLSTMAWGWAASGFRPGRSWWATYWVASTPQLHAHSSQELATAIWAAGKLQQHPPAAWTCGFAAASSRALAAAAVRPQEACMMVCGAAQLGLVLRPAWWECLRAAAAAGLPQWSSRDLAQVLWAHARLQQLPPAPWLSQVLAAAGACRGRFSPRDTAMLLWALAALRVSPPPQLLTGLLQVLMMSSCKLAAATPQDFAHILWSLAVFKQQQQQQQQQQGSPFCSSRSGSSSDCDDTDDNGSSSDAAHPLVDGQLLRRWTDTTWHYTLPAQAGLSAADAAQLLWAASQLGGSSSSCKPDADWMQQLWSSGRQQQLLCGASCQAMTVTMWAGLRLGSPPPRDWLLAAVPLLQQQLADLAPAGACQLLLVLARLQHRPNPAFMEQLLSRLQLDSHQLQPRAFACVLWALGRLGYQPGPTWWANILQHLQGQVEQLGRRELANVVSGLLELQVVGRLPPGLKQQLQQRAEKLCCGAGEVLD